MIVPISRFEQTVRGQSIVEFGLFWSQIASHRKDFNCRPSSHLEETLIVSNQMNKVCLYTSILSHVKVDTFCLRLKGIGGTSSPSI